MKKVMSLLLALILCLSVAMVCSAEEFVPSIEEKNGPRIVEQKDDQGKAVLGKILDKDGNVVGYIDLECLIVTPYSEADESDEIPDAARSLLKEVYKKLRSGAMKLPYEKFSAALNAANMVIRDLFDASWRCPDHPEIVAPKGVYVQLTFDLGVAPGEKVYVMSYKNEEWVPIESTNNGDGTVTCLFEDFCPITFSVEKTAGSSGTPATGDNMDITLWVSLLAVSVAGLAVLFVVGRKRSRENG